VMEMLERNGGASAPELASGDGEGKSAKCSHNVDDKVVTCQR
jgi:hypothetical protein